MKLTKNLLKNESRFKHRRKQGIEHGIKMNPDMWLRNGFALDKAALNLACSTEWLEHSKSSSVSGLTRRFPINVSFQCLLMKWPLANSLATGISVPSPGWRRRRLPSLPPVSQDDRRTSPWAAKGRRWKCQVSRTQPNVALNKTLNKTSEVPGKETLNCPKSSETSKNLRT